MDAKNIIFVELWKLCGAHFDNLSHLESDLKQSFLIRHGVAELERVKVKPNEDERVN